MCITPRITTRSNKITQVDFDINASSSIVTELDLDAMKDCIYIDHDDYTVLEKKESCLSILHLNMRELINKQSELNKILTHKGENKVDVALLCETWLQKETNNHINIPGYIFFRKIRQKKKGGGVGILLHNELKGKHCDDLKIETDVLENIVVQLKGNKSMVILASCYRAPNTDQVIFLKEYREFLKKLEGQNCPYLIGIDHNLDLIKNSVHHNTQSFIELNLENGCLPCISKPTRVTHKSATLIDNIFCAEGMYSKCRSYILLEDISDHLPCICHFSDVFPTKVENQYRTFRKLIEKNIDKIKTDLHEINWQGMLNKPSCSQKFNAFHDKLMQCIDTHAPEMISQVRIKPIKEMWLTPGLRKCQKKQKTLFNKTLKINGKAVTMDSVSKYRAYRSTLQKCKWAARQTYYHDQCMKLKQNTKGLWNIINEILKKKTNKLQTIESLNMNNIHKTNSLLIANEFGRYFSQVVKEFANKIEKPKTPIRDYINKIS